MLLLPYPDDEASIAILDTRTGWRNNERNVNRNILKHRSNYELATITIFTAEKNPEDIAEEIINITRANE